MDLEKAIMKELHLLGFFSNSPMMKPLKGG